MTLRRTSWIAFVALVLGAPAVASADDDGPRRHRERQRGGERMRDRAPAPRPQFERRERSRVEPPRAQEARPPRFTRPERPSRPDRPAWTPPVVRNPRPAVERPRTAPEALRTRPAFDGDAAARYRAAIDQGRERARVRPVETPRAADPTPRFERPARPAPQADPDARSVSERLRAFRERFRERTRPSTGGEASVRTRGGEAAVRTRTRVDSDRATAPELRTRFGGGFDRTRELRERDRASFDRERDRASGDRRTSIRSGDGSRAGVTSSGRVDIRDRISSSGSRHGGSFGHGDGHHDHDHAHHRHRHRGHVHRHIDGGFFVSWWHPWHYRHYSRFWVGGIPAFGFGVAYYEPIYEPYFDPGFVVWEPVPVYVEPQPVYPPPAYGPTYGPPSYVGPSPAPYAPGAVGPSPAPYAPGVVGPSTAPAPTTPVPAPPPVPEVDEALPGEDENDAAKQAFETGFRAFSEQRYEQALGMFRLVTDLDPKHGEAWLGYAHAAFALGQYSDAATGVARAAALGAFPRGYRFDPRPVYRTPGAFDTALQRLEGYSRSNPQDADAHLLLAWIQVGLGDKPKAEASLASLASLRADDPTAAFLRVAMLPPEPPPTAEEGTGGVPLRPPAQVVPEGQAPLEPPPAPDEMPR